MQEDNLEFFFIISIFSSQTWRWLRENLLNCKKELGKPYTRCRKAFRDAYEDCDRRLPPVIDLVCHIVNLAANICYICEINKVICFLVALIKEYIIDKIADAIGFRVSKQAFIKLISQIYTNLCFPKLNIENLSLLMPVYVYKPRELSALLCNSSSLNL